MSQHTYSVTNLAQMALCLVHIIAQTNMHRNIHTHSRTFNIGCSFPQEHTYMHTYIHTNLEHRMLFIMSIQRKKFFHSVGVREGPRRVKLIGELHLPRAHGSTLPGMCVCVCVCVCLHVHARTHAILHTCMPVFHPRCAFSCV
jgi:hypothetical protein